jgi:hypothetical protein
MSSVMAHHLEGSMAVCVAIEFRLVVLVQWPTPEIAGQKKHPQKQNKKSAKKQASQ